MSGLDPLGFEAQHFGCLSGQRYVDVQRGARLTPDGIG